ncbi:MAG TPA: BON domain-containing protein [Vicinamibacterales bacterium]|nr:BON domain-containing protein [Vicinamibacterales bacterium]
MWTILRLLIVVVVLLIVGSFLMGYVGGGRYALSWPKRSEPQTQSSDTVARARERGAEIGERAGAAAAKVEETVTETALSAKIKAKMALDDTVKARAIDVTTQGTTVTLRGTVESRAERERAVSLARETAGVTKVVDDLQLR